MVNKGAGKCGKKRTPLTLSANAADKGSLVGMYNGMARKFRSFFEDFAASRLWAFISLVW